MKLAIITGASSGIGLATAKLFLKYQFQVINISRRITEDKNIIDMPCNLAYESTITDVIDKLEPYLATAHEVCLVHSACKFSNDTADNCDIDSLKMSLAVNILAPSMLNRGVLHQLPSSSSVIYIGSTLSEKAVANFYTYITTKHATIGMMKATCQDLANKDIHTACIYPELAETELPNKHTPDKSIQHQLDKENGLNRFIEPEEIARLILFAHQNPTVNGSILHANCEQIEY